MAVGADLATALLAATRLARGTAHRKRNLSGFTPTVGRARLVVAHPSSRGASVAGLADLAVVAGLLWHRVVQEEATAGGGGGAGGRGEAEVSGAATAL